MNTTYKVKCDSCSACAINGNACHESGCTGIMQYISPRGGNIIGKTKSGKPIYDNAHHPAHRDFTPEEHEEGKHARAEAWRRGGGGMGDSYTFHDDEHGAGFVRNNKPPKKN